MGEEAEFEVSGDEGVEKVCVVFVEFKERGVDGLDELGVGGAGGDVECVDEGVGVRGEVVCGMTEVAAEREGKRFGGRWFEEKGRVEGFAMEAWVPSIHTGSNTISYVATAISTLHPGRVNTHPVIYSQFLSRANPITSPGPTFSFIT